MKWQPIDTVPLGTPVKVGVMKNGVIKPSLALWAYTNGKVWSVRYALSSKDILARFEPTHWHHLNGSERPHGG